MKKKIILMGIAAALVAATIIGGALAADSDTVSSTASVNTQSLDVTIEGASEFEIGADSDDAFMPGETYSKELYVTNTADVALYARVTIQKYWIVEDDSEEVTKDYDLDSTIIELISTATENGWVITYSDEEETVMYYSEPIESGDSSTNFLDGISIPADLDNSYQGTNFQLVVTTDAIQASSATDAMLSEWGVALTLDDDGNIVTVEE